MYCPSGGGFFGDKCDPKVQVIGREIGATTKGHRQYRAVWVAATVSQRNVGAVRNPKARHLQPAKTPAVMLKPVNALADSQTPPTPPSSPPARLLHQPVPRPLYDDAFHVVGHQPPLVDQELAAGLLPAQHQHGHRQLLLREAGKVLRILVDEDGLRLLRTSYA